MTHWKLIKELDANAISEMSYEDIIYISGGFDVMQIGLDLWDDLSRIWLKVVSWRWNFLNCAPISRYPDNSMHFTLIPFLLSISHTKKIKIIFIAFGREKKLNWWGRQWMKWRWKQREVRKVSFLWIYLLGMPVSIDIEFEEINLTQKI